jgi:hypothetical protein
VTALLGDADHMAANNSCSPSNGDVHT